MSRRLFAIAAGLAVVFVGFVVGVGLGRPGIDIEVAQWMADGRSPTVTDTAKAISVVGTAFVLVPLGIAHGLYLWRRDGWSPVRWLVLGTLGASALYVVFNATFQSSRPPMPLRIVDPMGWSFPSGHATQTIVFWPLVAMLYARRASWWLLPAGVIAVATGWSRIYLAAHFTTDVITGYLLGAAWLCTVLGLRARGSDRLAA